MITQRRRCDGQLELTFFSEEVDGFFRDFGVERGFFFESRKQFVHGARVEQGAGKAVLTDLAGFLEDVDIFFAELRVRIFGDMRVDELRKAQGAGHAGRPAADDDDVSGHLRALDAVDRFAEHQHRKPFAADLHGSSRIRQVTGLDPCECVVIRGRLPSRSRLLHFFDQRRDDVEQIAYDREVGDFENRSFGILIHRDDSA